MTLPHSISGSDAAVNLVTAGVHQFAAWYTLAGELRIGRIERGVNRWGVDHVEYEFAGTPRTALGMPVAADEHNYPCIAVDGLGKIHMWANMHTNPLRAVVSTTAHTTGDWLVTAGWASAASDFPSVEARCTYPGPVHLPDGSLWFALRDGPTGSGSGRSDSHYWTRGPAATSWSARTTLFQGLSVPDAGGPGIPGSDAGVEDLTNWNAYPSVPLVESPRGPHPGRMHTLWTWRELPTPEVNLLPSYARSDDGGVTWRAVDGTLLTVPITPLNSVAARVPGSALIRSIGRGFNVVVATVDTPAHGIVVGDSVRVVAQDSSYDGTFTVFALVSPTEIAWGQVAADDPAGGVGSICKTQLVLATANLGIDDDGLPHALVFDDANARWHLYHNGTAWVREAVPNPLNGVLLFRPAGSLWLYDGLWFMGGGGPASGVRYNQLWQFPSGGTVVVGGNTGTSSDYQPSLDPEAWRRFGTVEVLQPDGDSPRVVTFGNHARAVAA